MEFCPITTPISREEAMDIGVFDKSDFHDFSIAFQGNGSVPVRLGLNSYVQRYNIYDLLTMKIFACLSRIGTQSELVALTEDVFSIVEHIIDSFPTIALDSLKCLELKMMRDFERLVDVQEITGWEKVSGFLVKDILHILRYILTQGLEAR